MAWLGRDPKYDPESIIFCRHHCDACRKYQVSSRQPSAGGFGMVPAQASSTLALPWQEGGSRVPGASVPAAAASLPPAVGNDGLSVALQGPSLLSNHTVDSHSGITMKTSCNNEQTFP